MKHDDEMDYEVATDEESRRVRRLERELKSIAVSEDSRLFVFLGAALALILLYALSPGPATQWMVILAVPVLVIGGLGSVILQNIRRGRRVLIKHGLQCPQCGFVPSRLTASGVLGSRKCPKCAAPLKL